MARETSLVLRLHSLGDVVLAQPAVACAASRGPVLFITRPAYGPVAERFGPGVKVLCCSSEEGLRGLRERMRGISPSRVIDLQGNLTSFLALFPRRSSRFRTDRALRARILSGGGGRMPGRAGEFLRVAGCSGAAVPVLVRRAFPEKDRLEVGLVCGGRWALKSIPDGVLEELARLFADLSGARVWLIAGRGEGSCAGTVAARIGREGIRIFEGDTSALLDRIERLNLLVSPDSGPAHLAAALGVGHLVVFTSTSPALGFWDPADPSVYGPVVPCSPCHRHGGRACGRGDEACRTSLVPRLIFDKAMGRVTTP